MGPQGDDGIDGNPGGRGDQGQDGEKGQKGEVGETGDSGVQVSNTFSLVLLNTSQILTQSYPIEEQTECAFTILLWVPSVQFSGTNNTWLLWFLIHAGSQDLFQNIYLSLSQSC